MNPQALEQYLHEHIPLSKAMQVCVLEAVPERVIVSAPLAPNINHTESVFGGSASAVATLAAWSLVHVRLKSAGIASGIVIQNNTMSYEQPIHGSFTARSFIKQPEAWDVFMRTLSRRGRARIAVSAILDYEGQPAGNFEGNFVAIVKEPGIR
ncbi:thioesterase domain-containing protein [Methylomonas rapida]|uniref:Thioesterase domain-containing protein n=1 Tax=Methylomonas rapida TaxID=2963939 RepID=A0ABY7GFF2_9GAMM|nr:thioesterase domain-containing protein [Methylomonas rapida]WAR43974.1 thioesterase domain-containing protein [Methylomonas rapida]